MTSADFDNDGDADLAVANSNSNTVSVLRNVPGSHPVAVNDARTVGEDSGTTALNVLANDTDADGDAIEITAVTQPANGSAAITQGSPDTDRLRARRGLLQQPGWRRRTTSRTRSTVARPRRSR